MQKKRRLVPYLVRHGSTGTLERTYRRHDGGIPARVWFMLNKRVRKLDRQAYFYPLDAMDAYQETILCLERKAADKPRLDSASMEGYLAAAMKKSLLRFHLDKVLPVRRAYRQVEDELFAKAAIESCDGDDDSVSLQQLAEAMPGMPSAEERRRLAASALGDVLDALDDPEISRAFVAYVVADGNFVEAAHLAHIGVNRFYAMWRSWLAAARRAAEYVKTRI